MPEKGENQEQGTAEPSPSRTADNITNGFASPDRTAVTTGTQSGSYSDNNTVVLPVVFGIVLILGIIIAFKFLPDWLPVV